MDADEAERAFCVLVVVVACFQMVKRELSAFTRLASRRAPRVGRRAERVLAWRLAEVTVRRMAPRASRWHHPPARLLLELARGG